MIEVLLLGRLLQTADESQTVAQNNMFKWNAGFSPVNVLQMFRKQTFKPDSPNLSLNEWGVSVDLNDGVSPSGVSTTPLTFPLWWCIGWWCSQLLHCVKNKASLYAIQMHLQIQMFRFGPRACVWWLLAELSQRLVCNWRWGHLHDTSQVETSSHSPLNPRRAQEWKCKFQTWITALIGVEKATLKKVFSYHLPLTSLMFTSGD